MKNKEKDYVMRTVGFQSVISLIILGIIFSISKLNPPLLEKLSNELLPLITLSLTREDAEDAFKDIRQILFIDDGLSTKKTEDTDNEDVSEKPESTDNKGEDASVSESDDKEETAPEIKPDSAFQEELTATVEPSENMKKISLNLNRDGDDVIATASTLPYSLNTTIYSPLSGKITSNFGKRIHPVYNCDSFHTGIDIAGKTGENIRSIADGKVIRTSYNQWNGHYVEIDHGNTITTMYCHCSKILVKKGASVKGGEAIAQVGNTGVSTGPHLHFEFRIDGVSYNPLYALNSAADAV